MLLLFYIILPTVLVIGTLILLISKAVQNFHFGKQNQGIVFVILTVLFMYGIFHKVTFGEILFSGDKWNVSIRNESSVDNPQIIADFKNLYVHDRIKLNGRTGFYTKNSGYEFYKLIVPKGIKAEIYISDFSMRITLTDK